MSLPASHTEALSGALNRKRRGEPEWNYFNHRVRSPEEARRSLPYKQPSNKEQLFTETLENPAPSHNRVIYVHIPFCKKICRFCGYNRMLLPDDKKTDAFIHALISYIRFYGNTPWALARDFDALYFGGGTPTALRPHDLIRVIKAVKETLPLSDNAEITVESCFDGITQDDLGMLADAGVNRISFGVQSFDTDLRRAMGRVHDDRFITETLKWTGSVGIQNVCADLIYNMPGQTPEIWKHDLKRVSQSPVTGLSIYPLILFDGSLLTAQIRKKEVPALGGLEAEYRFFTDADKYLTKQMNWRRFTPVQYGDNRIEKAEYIRAHGQGYDVLGIGPGAAGRIGTMVYINPRDSETYIAGNRNCPGADMMILQLPQTYLEARKWYRLSEGHGISLKEVSGIFPGTDEIVEQLEALGLVKKEGQVLSLTRVGCFWAGNISGIISEMVGSET